MLRTPAVAGQFYPGGKDSLSAMLEELTSKKVQSSPAKLVVSPHAGYVYSGAVAGKVLSAVKIPQKVVVAGPNHRGLGSQAAVMTRGHWQTPLGEVPLDSKLGNEIQGRSLLVRDDPLAHQHEHSLEVQIPFLQHLRPDFLLTPLCLGGLSLGHCLNLGQDLGRAIKASGQEVLMVASTDMTHYETADEARKKDAKALERIQALDPKGLYNTVRGMAISMCGVIPTTVCLAAALELGATRAELVQYTNSGEVSGDFDQVVGYAGLIVD